MNFDLFLCDFDGTLVRADGTVTDANKRAIAEYRRRGGIFVICTGRMMLSIRARLAELGLCDGLVAAFHGAQIADIASGELLRNVCFRAGEAERILRFAEGKRLRFQMYVDGELIAPFRSELLSAYERVCGVQARISETPLSDMVATQRLNVTKIVFLCNAEETQKVYRLLAENFGEEFYVATSSDYLVEVLPKEATKAAACDFLADYYGVPHERVAAIGDQIADIPMIAAAGGKFAVSNGVEELKKIATVVPSADGDGVAYTLRKYAMGEEL